MDLFTGRKIADLRKFNSLSQEALSEKVGVSRQAISKWERGEATPDMENIIALARIFNVSVDDLLGDKKANEITDFPALERSAEPAAAEPAEPAVSSVKTEVQGARNEKTEKANAGEPAAAVPGAPYEAKKPGKEKRLGKKLAARLKKFAAKKKNAPRYRPELADKLQKIPVFVIVPALYVIFGIIFHFWHPGWLSILFIPIYYMFIWACNGSGRKSFLYRLPIPFLALFLFIFTGLLFDLWHPGWIVFLCVPLYYAAVWKTIDNA